MTKRDNSITIAVIGAGNIGIHHIRNLLTFPKARVVVADTSHSKLKQVHDKYRCVTYKSIDDLLQKEPLHAAIVSVPTTYHCVVAKKLLSQKIPTLIEKPIASTIYETQELIKLAKKNETILFVGHIERFNKAIHKVKKLLSQGEIGQVVSIAARRVGLFPPKFPDTNVIVDLAVHDIDIFSYLLDETPIRVHASGGKILLKNLEDHAELFLRYRSGTSGYIQVSWITPVKIRNLSITGTKGFIDLDYIKQTIQIVHNHLTDTVFDSFGQFVLKSEPTKKFFMHEHHEEPLKLELASFLSSVRTGKPPEVPAEVGLAALEIALEATEDLRKQNAPYGK